MSEERENQLEGAGVEGEPAKQKKWKVRTVSLKSERGGPALPGSKAQEIEDRLNELEEGAYQVSQIFAQEGAVVILGRLQTSAVLGFLSRAPEAPPTYRFLQATKAIVDLCTNIVDSTLPREKYSEEAASEVSKYLSKEPAGVVDRVIEELIEWEGKHNETCDRGDPQACEVGDILSMAKGAVAKYKEIRTN